MNNRVSETSNEKKRNALMRKFRNLLLPAAVALVAMTAVSPASAAEFEGPISAELSSLAAGGHTDFRTAFTVATTPTGETNCFSFETFQFNGACFAIKGGSVKDVPVEQPLGLVGNPQNFPQCSADAVLHLQCPVQAQVGLVRNELLFRGTKFPPQFASFFQHTPVYNMPPERGEVARLGFQGTSLFPQAVEVTVGIKVEPDGRLHAEVNNAPTGLPLISNELKLWGVPGDSSHDPERSCDNFNLGCSLPEGTPVVPFLANGTDCGTPVSTTISLRSWSFPDEISDSQTSAPQALEGCEGLAFEPSISAQPSGFEHGQPTGLNLEISVPQHWDNPEGTETPPLEDTEITFPKGMTINPSSADGLGACSDEQLRLGLEGSSDCPLDSKLGTIEVETPVLEEGLSGTVWLRNQASGNPSSGDMYRIALELQNQERGIDLKLPGSLFVDPGSGQITAKALNAPQLPFSHLRVHLKVGSRAALTLPEACGPQTVEAQLKGWGVAASSHLQDTFTTLSGKSAADCPGGFAPKLSAGAESPIGGASSPFLLKLTRGDGEQNLARVDVTLPPGELAKLAGVPLCPDAAASNGSCDSASRIGSLNVAVGSGATPLWVPQPGKPASAVYLAGAYKAAPYSLVFEVPAQAGPFDLGSVAVRAGIYVDPESTQATIKSDSLPQILGGVPLRYRTVAVNVDRAGFMQSPTSCDPMAVTAAVTSATGTVADLSDHFQLGNCGALAFKPKLTLRLEGKTRRTGHPALNAVLKMPADGANIGRAVVRLPKSEFLDQSHIAGVCTRVQYAASQCPKGSVYGYARAYTPLLDKALEGPVYLRSNGGDRKLPDLVASLGGQLHVDLVGFIDSKGGGLRTTFANVPDAPISKFVLQMKGGKKGLLENSTELCRGVHKADADFDAHNGKIADSKPKLEVTCRGKHKRHHRGHGR